MLNYENSFNLFSENNFTLKIADKNDIPRIMNFQQRIIDDMENKNWFTPLTEKEFLTPIENLDNVYMLFDGEKEVALFVATCNIGDELNEYGVENRNNMLIDSTMVEPEYRGMGLQRKILKFLEKRALDLGLNGLVATVHPDNIYSLNNFIKSGYEIIDKREIHGGPRLVLEMVI